MSTDDALSGKRLELAQGCYDESEWVGKCFRMKYGLPSEAELQWFRSKPRKSVDIRQPEFNDRTAGFGS